MQTKKALAGAFFGAVLVITPVGVASATPVTDTSPAVVDVSHHGNDHDRGYNDHYGKGDNHRRHDRDWNNDWNHWNNPWQPNCFWYGPWWVCQRW
jgi:hypothetical protein